MQKAESVYIPKMLEDAKRLEPFIVNPMSIDKR